MARLDELLQREAPGPARDTLLRLAGQGAPAPKAAQAAPINVTELGPPTENPREAVQRAVDRGVPREVAGQAATQAVESEGGFWSNFLTALPMLLAGPGAFAATLAGQSIHGNLQQQRQAAHDAGVQTRSAGMSMFQEAMARSGNPQAAAAEVFRNRDFAQLVAEDPELLPMIHQAVTTAQGPAPAAAPTSIREAEAMGMDLSTPEGRAAYAQWKQSQTRPPVPSAVIHQPADEKRASIMAAERAAPGGQIDVELRGLDTQASNTEFMLSLLGQGVEPGKWTDAVKRAVKDRLGFDVGLDPKLEAFNSIAASETLTALGQIKGNPTEGERSFVQQLTAQAGLGPEANKAVLRVRKAVIARQTAELREEKAYYSRNGTLAGFDTYIQDWGAKQGSIIPDDVIRSVTGDLAKNQAAEAQTFTGLADALQAGNATAVAGFVAELTREQLTKLPTATLEAINRLLEE